MAEGQFIQNPDGSWSQQVTQTGSVPKRAIGSGTFFNAIAITDTATKTSPTVDVAGYTKKIISFSNTLNQTVSLTLYGTSADGTTKSISNAMTLPAGGGGFIGAYYGIPSTAVGLQEPMVSIYTAVSCTTAPTSGSLTLKIGLEA